MVKKRLLKMHYYFSYVITFLLLVSLLVTVLSFLLNDVLGKYTNLVILLLSVCSATVFVMKCYKPSVWN